MTQTKLPRGRIHDAARARETILDAAEKVFAEHGFDGARTEVIAAEAGYNKSLIFQYYGDKVSLYAAVIRRADDQTRGLQAQVFASLLGDQTVFDAARLKALVKVILSAYFDYLAEHPRLTRILLWEMAEGWQTYAKIVSQRDIEDVDQIKPFLEKLRKAGLLRSGLHPIAQISLAEFFVPCYLSSISLYKTLLPDEDFSSATALAHAREYVVEFVVRGLVIDPAEAML